MAARFDNLLMPQFTDELEGEEVVKLDAQGDNIVLSADQLERLRTLQAELENDFMIDDSAELTLDSDRVQH